MTTCAVLRERSGRGRDRSIDSGPREHKRGTRTVRGVVSPAFLDVRHADRWRRTEKIRSTRKHEISDVAECAAI